jgi:endogenous inhibitor of DNA gyrase (YacG/DUF329 family)
VGRAWKFKPEASRVKNVDIGRWIGGQASVRDVAEVEETENGRRAGKIDAGDW